MQQSGGLLLAAGWTAATQSFLPLAKMQIDPGQRHQIASGGNALRTAQQIEHRCSVTMVRIWIAQLHQKIMDTQMGILYFLASYSQLVLFDTVFVVTSVD